MEILTQSTEMEGKDPRSKQRTLEITSGAITPPHPRHTLHAEVFCVVRERVGIGALNKGQELLLPWFATLDRE